jgi:hypothetical protein
MQFLASSKEPKVLVSGEYTVSMCKTLQTLLAFVGPYVFC